MSSSETQSVSVHVSVHWPGEISNLLASGILAR